MLAYKVLVLNPSTISKLGMVAQAYNHNTRVVEAGKSRVPIILGYIMTLEQAWETGDLPINKYTKFRSSRSSMDE